MSVTDGIGPYSLEHYLVWYYNRCSVCIISVSLLVW